MASGPATTAVPDAAAAAAEPWASRLSDPEQLLKDCEVELLRGSGPGGQHRNKVESGVRLTHLPTGTVATATERRSQSQNREVALERLIGKLRALLVRRKPRRATRKSRSVRNRELDDKRRRGAVKRERRGAATD